ncbi:MAG: ATP-binding cassette domain-containing protein [Xanthobacteraceae bacterium]
MLDGYALRKAFHSGTPNQRVALADVTLSLAAGDFAVVIGSNGAGKSTLLNAIAGEVRVDSGRIEIDGRDVTAEPTHRRASAIARVFQDPSVGTAGPMTIEENLALAERRGARNGLRLGLSSSARRRYRNRLAAIGLGLEDRLGQKVELLSGGQRQSLALLMAVLATPKLLLLDEHTAALDPKTADVVMRATTQAVAHDRLTTLMVTHNMQHALDYGNRLIMMNEGRIVFEAHAGEKAALTIERLVQRFHLASDRMLLG